VITDPGRAPSWRSDFFRVWAGDRVHRIEADADTPGSKPAAHALESKQRCIRIA